MFNQGGLVMGGTCIENDDGIDCHMAAVRDGRCAAHAKRRQRGSSASGPIRKYESPRDRVRAAALALADAEADDDTAYQRAEWRFWRAIEMWAKRRRGRPA